MKAILFLLLAVALPSVSAASAGAQRNGERIEYASERNIAIGCDGSWLAELGPRVVEVKSKDRSVRKTKNKAKTP